MPEKEEKEVKALPEAKEIEKHFCFKASDIDADERTVTAIISSNAIDRDGEVLLPKGAEIERFMQNPVVLWSHNNSEPPIGKALWVKKGRGKVTAKVEFADTEPAEEIYQLFKGGFLKAFSVGIIAKNGHVPTPTEISKVPELAQARRIIDEWELLEFSAVAVPANQEALATHVKSNKLQYSVLKDFDLTEDEHWMGWDGTKEIPLEKVTDKEKEMIEMKKTPVKMNHHFQMTKHIEITSAQMTKVAMTEVAKKRMGKMF